MHQCLKRTPNRPLLSLPLISMTKTFCVSAGCLSSLIHFCEARNSAEAGMLIWPCGALDHEKAVEKSIPSSMFHVFLSPTDCSGTFLDNCAVTDLLSHQVLLRLDRLKKGKAKDSHSKVKEKPKNLLWKESRRPFFMGTCTSVGLSDPEKEDMLLADLTEPEKNKNVEEIKGLSLDFQSRHVVVSAQVLAKVSRAPHQGNVQPSRFSDETKAWTIHACGIIASQATGVIHSDFEKGFIRTETHFYPLNESVGQKLDCLFVQLRFEGIVYIVKEGYFMLFLFNI
ncbi:hypothetical protein HID58_087785 [Brassica napus]|uniref:YchF C-terminal domain-containing protein n=1 Tax=Brassica napus TaxID=3708 RepID=A0ABQ7XUA6_BRANA|nr:hypothetical protein HID58_087785 [Brassica napus]